MEDRLLTRQISAKHDVVYIFVYLFSMCQSLCPLAYSDSESMNPFRYFYRIPWAGDRPIARYNIEKHEYRPIVWAGFDPTNPTFARSKTTRLFDRTNLNVVTFWFHKTRRIC
jgi:hypothetical protein